MSNYFGHDPERWASMPADDDASRVSALEVAFAIAVWVTPAQMRRLADLVTEILRAPENTPRAGVHWLSGHGAKPILSERVARFLSVAVPGASDRPADGEEPKWDDETAYFETTARPFVDEQERRKHGR